MKELLFMIDPQDTMGLKLKTFEYLEDCLEDAIHGDIVILDWGGLSVAGVSGFIDSYERETLKAIQEKPSVMFVFYETMEGYYDESFYEYPNVTKIGRTASLEGWKSLLSNYS
jgi:hypothetical protein